MTKRLAVTALMFGSLYAGAVQAACPMGTDSRGMVDGKERCALKGKYLSTTMTLTSNNEYVLEDAVFIGGDNKENSTLRIEAGTKIMGAPGSFVAIMRGSRIEAEGTRTRPIVFTALKATGRKAGEWGGVVINGNAPINACAAGTPVCEAVSEGIKVEQVKFGGNQPDESSGTLRYVRVEFAGYPISQDNELNGITFNGVGRGTEVEYIQVHMNADDGVEFFGGTVNVKYVVLTGNEDDSMDWDMGWTGKGQFIVVDQMSSVADNGIEADNLASPMNAEPRSNPELSNVTFIGAQKSSYGMLLRRGTGGSLHNVIISGFVKACIDIDDSETFRIAGDVRGSSVEATGLKLQNSILHCAKSFEEEAGDAYSLRAWYSSQAGNREVDPKLSGWVPMAGSPALKRGMVPDDLFFDAVDFIGAIGSKQTDWTAGWTTRALN